MKKFIKNYINIVAYSFTGLIFMFASFYLLINYYHYEELKKPLYVSENDISYKNYNDKLNKIKLNLENYDSKGMKNKDFDVMYNHLLSCYNVMNKDSLSNMKVNTYYHPIDIYNIGANFQSNNLNVCWALHLSYLTKDSVPSKFKNISPMIVNEIGFLTNETNNALSEIKNNSSYFYTTNITSATIRSYLYSDYQIITNSYNQFADIILTLSNMINEGGSNA